MRTSLQNSLSVTAPTNSQCFSRQLWIADSFYQSHRGTLQWKKTHTTKTSTTVSGIIQTINPFLFLIFFTLLLLLLLLLLLWIFLWIVLVVRGWGTPPRGWGPHAPRGWTHRRPPWVTPARWRWPSWWWWASHWRDKKVKTWYICWDQQ